jgi:hypothetical protein
MVYVCHSLNPNIFFFHHRSFRNRTLGEKINWPLRHDLRQGYIPRNIDVYLTGTREINQSTVGSTWCSEWRHRGKNTIKNNVFTVIQRCLELTSRETSRTCLNQNFHYLLRKNKTTDPNLSQLSLVNVLTHYLFNISFNPLNAKLNPICHLLALLGAHHILHVSRVRVNSILSWTPAFSN